MTSEEYQSYIKWIQDSNIYLNLSYEQAEKMCAYEQEKNIYSDKHYFTDWEEWDYKLTRFRELLNEEQLKSYEISHAQNIQHHQEGLIEQDKEKIREIAYNSEALQFYETQFFPAFIKDPFHSRYFQNQSHSSKIQYLKAEYRQFLSDTKKLILTSHFRFNRTFKPNELKASLLRHKLSYIVPNYTSFKHQMDEPTQAAANYLQSYFQYLPEKTEALLKQKFDELKEFNDTNFKKHYTESRLGSFVFGQLTTEEERVVRIMTLLLIDKDKYGV